MSEPTVTLNGWYRNHPPQTVGGSLYAVPADDRVEAARVLHENGCRVHADIIIGPDGHRGLTTTQLEEIRDAVPNCRLDLHLIVLDTTADRDEAAVIDAAQTLHVDTLTLAAPQIQRHAHRLTDLRTSGTLVWEEIPPGASQPTELQHIDGALVMLIQPGSTQAADPRQIDKISTLAPRMPVGVDGGVTPTIARHCHEAGAGYLISGRALLHTGSPHQTTTPERRPA